MMELRSARGWFSIPCRQLLSCRRASHVAWGVVGAWLVFNPAPARPLMPQGCLNNTYFALVSFLFRSVPVLSLLFLSFVVLVFLLLLLLRLHLVVVLLLLLLLVLMLLLRLFFLLFVLLLIPCFLILLFFLRLLIFLFLLILLLLPLCLLILLLHPSPAPPVLRMGVLEHVPPQSKQAHSQRVGIHTANANMQTAKCSQCQTQAQPLRATGVAQTLAKHNRNC